MFYCIMNILFICNQNQNRSKTAAELFKGKFKIKSAGLYNDTELIKSLKSKLDYLLFF